MKSTQSGLPTWHTKHLESFTVGQRLADWIARFAGSWKFIIFQTVLVIIWMTLNLIGYVYHWDPYPFVLLNLLFSTQAAYAAPIIMMSQNRQSERDRAQALNDYETNIDAKREIENLQKEIARIERDKLDLILETLKNKQL